MRGEISLGLTRSPIIIGLAGKQQVGKDTCADYLVKRYGFIRIGFADRLKEVARALGWDGKKDERGRKFLQALGTEAVRGYNPNYWINYVFDRIAEEHQKGQGRFCISDVRFINECEAIKKGGGILLKINRNTGIVDEHKSETDLDGYPEFLYSIDNNGTIADLYVHLDNIITRLSLAMRLNI